MSPFRPFSIARSWCTVTGTTIVRSADRPDPLTGLVLRDLLPVGEDGASSLFTFSRRGLISISSSRTALLVSMYPSPVSDGKPAKFMYKSAICV